METNNWLNPLFLIFWEEPQPEPTVVVVTPPTPEPEPEQPTQEPPTQEPPPLTQTEIFQLGQRVGVLEMENQRLAGELSQAQARVRELEKPNQPGDDPGNLEPNPEPQPEPQPTNRAIRRPWWG